MCRSANCGRATNLNWKLFLQPRRSFNRIARNIKRGVSRAQCTYRILTLWCTCTWEYQKLVNFTIFFWPIHSPDETCCRLAACRALSSASKIDKRSLLSPARRFGLGPSQSVWCIYIRRTFASLATAFIAVLTLILCVCFSARFPTV